MPQFLPVIMGTVATAGATYGVSEATKSIIPKMPEMPQPPKTETAEETIAKAKAQSEKAIRARQIAAGRSKSIYTSPLGIAGEAMTIRKTLLGQ